MIINPYVFGVAYNPLTTAWITATGETDNTIITALNTFEQGLIDYSLTSKILALYPMVGGTATKHKYNFMNAVDSDAAFRLVFYGGWTHSATGALPNGTTGYANTYFNVLTNLTQNNNHISYYSRTNATGNADIGAVVGIDGLVMTIKYSDNNSYWGCCDRLTTGAANVVSDTRGLFTATRIASGTRKLYKNGTSISSVVPAINAVPNYNIFLGARSNTGAPEFYGNKECAMASIGTGFTDGEASTFYTLVQAFQTSLSRNV